MSRILAQYGRDFTPGAPPTARGTAAPAKASKKHNSKSKYLKISDSGKRTGLAWAFGRKVGMGGLRRGISVMFATMVAIGAGIVFVPVAVLVDPVTRTAGLALTQYAILVLNEAVPAGPAGGDFALLSRFVWAAAVSVCAVPVMVVAWIGEIAKIRASIWYAIATGFVAASAPWFIRATLHLPRVAGYNFAELRFALVFFLGGLISGSVYWLIAGRNAGGTAPA